MHWRIEPVLLFVLGCAASSITTPPQKEIADVKRAAAATSTVSPPSRATPPAQRRLSPKVQRARAKRALPPSWGDTARLLTQAGSTVVVAFLPAESARGGKPHAELALIDASVEPAQLVARHEFASRADEAAESQLSVEDLVIVKGPGQELVVLAEMRGHTGEIALCGWWLPGNRPRFVCAPKMPGPSRYAAEGEALVEYWQDSFPPSSMHGQTSTGRIFHLLPTGSWREVDHFRCLGRPLASVLADAAGWSLRSWQRTTVERLQSGALRASEELHTDRGVALLRDALAVDACEVETWRLLGRLEVEAGHTASAVPQLAVAVALSPREAAPLVDLADALLVLDAATPADQTAFAAARDLLADRRPTKTLVSGAHGPRDLARALYAAYLERTATDADRHRSRRRRVQQEIRRLGGSAAKEPSGSGAHPSRHL